MTLTAHSGVALTVTRAQRPPVLLKYGNFDIVLDHVPPITRRIQLYLVPMPMGCWVWCLQSDITTDSRLLTFLGLVHVSRPGTPQKFPIGAFSLVTAGSI